MQHTRVIRVSRHGQYDMFPTNWCTSHNTGLDWPKHMWRIHLVWKGYTSYIYEAEKEAFWYPPGRYVILEGPNWYIKVLGFWTEPLLIVCLQQQYRRIVMQHILVCGLPQYIPCAIQCGWQYYRYAEQKIRKRGITHCHLGQSPWVPGNYNRFFNIREDGNMNLLLSQ